MRQVLLAVLLIPMSAVAADENCLGQPVTCARDVFGKPTQQRGYADILEYQELKEKYGKYFYSAPEGNTQNSGAVLDKNGELVKDQETLIYDHPRILGTPYHFACRVEFNTEGGIIIASYYECAEGCSISNGRSLAAIRTQDLPESCIE